MSPGAGWLILMNGRPESGSMSRAIFSLLTFQRSSASCLFILHALISVAGDDESAMNPGLRLCTELPRETVWKFGIGPRIGAPRAAKRGRRSPDSAPLAATEAR